MILNILHNAIDAIGKDGAIDISSRADGGRIVVEFADTGPGLTAEVMDHLYDPFFTTKPKGKGTGLGLYVSRDVMARLGGELTAANRAEGGAVFSVHLPLHGADARGIHQRMKNLMIDQLSPGRYGGTTTSRARQGCRRTQRAQGAFIESQSEETH
ncbi:MAG: ATP-binding protein [Chromatiales bacterium]|nr:ATP-binding protein [Chromatiales bacterium]